MWALIIFKHIFVLSNRFVKFITFSTSFKVLHFKNFKAFVSKSYRYNCSGIFFHLETRDKKKEISKKILETDVAKVSFMIKWCSTCHKLRDTFQAFFEICPHVCDSYKALHTKSSHSKSNALKSLIDYRFKKICLALHFFHCVPRLQRFICHLFLKKSLHWQRRWLRAAIWGTNEVKESDAI